MKERILFWDNIKGILIFLVVFGHFIYSWANTYSDDCIGVIYTLIYTFHMPAFVFVSGYFSKSERSRNKESIYKLLLCYIIFNTLMLMFAYFYMGNGLKLVTPYYSYWYILSLVAWRLLIGEVSSAKWIIPILVAITLLMGFWSEFDNTFSLRRTIGFFVFFAAGYKFDRNRIENIIKKRNFIHRIIGFALLFLFVLGVIYIIKKDFINASMTMMAPYKNMDDMLLRILLLIIASVAIVLLILIVPNSRIPLVSTWGRNSLLIYLSHRFITIIFYKELFTADAYENVFIVYALVCSVITCCIFGGEKISKEFNNFIDKTSSLIINDEKNSIIKSIFLIVLILCLSIKPITMYFM